MAHALVISHFAFRYFFLSNNEVTITREHKHLGLILHSKLSFESHINEKIKIARKGMGTIKYPSNYLPISTLDQIYKMYIRPHLNLCDVIYHIPKISDVSVPSSRLHNLMNAIEKIQYQAALVITTTTNNNNEFISSQYTKNSTKLIKIDNIKIKYKNNLNIIKIDLKIQEETIYNYSTYETYIWNINFADSTRA